MKFSVSIILVALISLSIAQANPKKTKIPWPRKAFNSIQLSTPPLSDEREQEVRRIEKTQGQRLKSDLLRLFNDLGQQGRCHFEAVEKSDGKGNAYIELKTKVDGQTDRYNHLYLKDLLKFETYEYEDDADKMTWTLSPSIFGGIDGEDSENDGSKTAKLNLFSRRSADSSDFKTIQLMMPLSKKMQIEGASFTTYVKSPRTQEAIEGLKKDFKEIKEQIDLLGRSRSTNDAFDKQKCEKNLNKIKGLSRWFAPYIEGCTDSQTIALKSSSSVQDRFLPFPYFTEITIDKRINNTVC